MIKEFKEELASMYSLMERMNKHMSGFQAEYNKETYLNEAFNGQNITQLHPKVFLSVAVDNQTRNKEVEIHLQGLTQQSVKKVRNSGFGMSDNCSCDVANGTIELTKEIPYFEVNKRGGDDANAQGTANANADGGDDDFNLDDELDSLLLNEADDFDDFNLDDELAGLFGDDDAEDDTTTDGGDTNAQGGKPLSKVDADVLKWLNTDYKTVIDLVTDKQKSGAYDKGAMAELYDINNLFAIYMGQKKSPEELRILNNKSDSQIIQEVKDALKNGNYSQFASQMITPLNIDAVIWGNQLSPRNARKALTQAQAYGFTPTMLHGATMWPKFYNRTVRPGARPFYLSTNYGGRHFKKDTGSKGHAEGFNNNANFKSGPYAAYDISDTDILDTNKPDFYNAVPGMKNNITGEINQAAIDYIQQVKNSIPTDLLQKAEATGTDGGKARIYNEVLIAYTQQELKTDLGLVPLSDKDDDNKCISVYIQNVYKLSEYAISLYNFANAANTKPLVDALAFSIALYTTGAHLLKMGGGYNTDIKSTWDREAATLVSIISVIFRFIRARIKSAFAPLRAEINKLLQAQKQVGLVDGDDDGNTVAAAASTPSQQQTSTVNESVKRKSKKGEESIEALLESFIC